MQNDSDPLQHSFNQLKPNGVAIGIEITGGYADTLQRYGRSSSGDDLQTGSFLAGITGAWIGHLSSSQLARLVSRGSLGVRRRNQPRLQKNLLLMQRGQQRQPRKPVSMQNVRLRSQLSETMSIGTFLGCVLVSPTSRTRGWTML